jgi:hypothetical protein
LPHQSFPIATAYRSFPIATAYPLLWPVTHSNQGTGN